MRAYIVIFLFLLPLSIFSQEKQGKLWYEKNFPAYKAYFENEFGIICNRPGKFKNQDKYYVLWKVREDKDKRTGYIYGPLFLSNDKECVIMYSAQAKFRTELNDHYRANTDLPIYPQSQIIAEIKTSIGNYYGHKHPLNKKTGEFNFDDYVTTVLGKKPHEMFNADSIFIYDLPHADSVYFFDEALEKRRKKKYPYCTGMFICKDGRAIMEIKLFFSAKGKQKQDEYINMLSKKIWYDEDSRNE